MRLSKSLRLFAALAMISLLLCGCAEFHPEPVPKRPGFTEILHVCYTRSQSPFLQGDLYLPNAPGPHPTILLIHGGGWVWGYDNDWAVAWMARKLVRRGYAVFNIDYRWAGHGGGFPRSIEDVKNAWAWLMIHRARYNLSKHRLTIVGLSAGAYLALMAAYTRDLKLFPARDYPSVHLAANAVIAFYPPTNLSEVRSIAHWWAFGVAGKFMDRWVSLHDGRGYRYASPVSYASDGMRTYILQGLLDVIVPAWQADELATKLKKYHIPVSVYYCPWASHAFMDFPGPARWAGWNKFIGILNRLDGSRTIRRDRPEGGANDAPAAAAGSALRAAPSAGAVHARKSARIPHQPRRDDSQTARWSEGEHQSAWRSTP